MTNNRITEELGTLGLLTDDMSLSELKSPKNTHLFLLCIGGETREELAEELADVTEFINNITNAPFIEVDGAKYELQPFLVCDMKSRSRSTKKQKSRSMSFPLNFFKLYEIYGNKR